jgi:hypothetical protein
MPSGRFKKIRKDPEFSGTHQLQVYADDDNIPHKNLNVIKKNTEALLGASMDGGLEVNSDKTTYVVISLLKSGTKL